MRARGIRMHPYRTPAQRELSALVDAHAWVTVVRAVRHAMIHPLVGLKFIVRGLP